jgi:hypothetical protein
VNDFHRFLAFVHSGVMSGFSITEQTSFLSICNSLGNSRLTFLLLDSLFGRIGNVESRSERSEESEDFGQNVGFSAESAELFYGYSVDLIQRIQKGMLHEILNPQKLKLENEDQFVKTLIDLRSDYFEFWRYIEVTNLTFDGIKRFIDKFPFDELTELIWMKIKDRLQCCESFTLSANPYQGGNGFNSMIVKDYPRILDDFTGKDVEIALSRFKRWI